VRYFARRVLTKLLWVVMVPCLAAAQKTAAVRLHAVDQSGHGLGPVEVRRFAGHGVAGSDYRSRFAGGEAKGIPFGEYDVDIRAGGILMSGSVSVRANEVFSVLSPSGMFFGPLHVSSVEYRAGSEPVLKGKIADIPEKTSRPIWVRIFKLYPGTEGDCCRTARIGEDGSFSAPLFSAGEYVVVVLNDSGSLYNGLLRLKDPSSEVQIDIGTGDAKVQPLPLSVTPGR
jgi:hypothetical protein